MGKPLIAHTIEVAKNCPSIGRIIVSTDSEKIASVSKEWGAEVPFLRPASISEDTTLDLPVFEHCLQWLEEKENYKPDIIVHLRPTSPLRTVEMVEKAIALLVKDPKADAVRGVCEPRQNPFKMWTIAEGGYLKPLVDSGIPEQYNQPRQKLPQAYWQNGYIDVARRSTILEKKSMTGNRILPLVLDAADVIDIDDATTIALAELMLKGRK